MLTDLLTNTLNHLHFKMTTNNLQQTFSAGKTTKWIATTHSKGPNPIKVWDFSTGRLVKSLEGHLCGVTCITFSADGMYVLAGCADSTVLVWNFLDNTVGVLNGHDTQVREVAASRDGKYFASVCDNFIHVWQFDNSKNTEMKVWFMNKIKLEGESTMSMKFAKNDKWIVTSGFNRDENSLGASVKCWDVATGRLVTKSEHNSESIDGRFYFIDLDNDENWLVTFADDDKVIVWDFSNMTEHSVGQQAHTIFECAEQTFRYGGRIERCIEGQKISPDGKYLVFYVPDKRAIVLFDWKNNSVKQEIIVSGSVRNLFYTNDGQLVVSLHDNEVIQICDPLTGQPIQNTKNKIDCVDWINYVALF